VHSTIDCFSSVSYASDAIRETLKFNIGKMDAQKTEIDRIQNLLKENVGEEGISLVSEDGIYL